MKDGICTLAESGRQLQEADRSEYAQLERRLSKKGSTYVGRALVNWKVAQKHSLKLIASAHDDFTLSIPRNHRSALQGIHSRPYRRPHRPAHSQLRLSLPCVAIPNKKSQSSTNTGSRNLISGPSRSIKHVKNWDPLGVGEGGDGRTDLQQHGEI